MLAKSTASPNWYLSYKVFVIAAVNVVLPWSTWPIVPILTCGLVLSNLAFAILNYLLNNLNMIKVFTISILLLIISVFKMFF